MYIRVVDGLRLFLLGRRLMQIAEAGFARSGAVAPPVGSMLVLEDVVTHPGSSITDITARTGFPQSHVSTLVARFRSAGIVDTSKDLRDGRRTLVRASREYVRKAARRSTAAVDVDIAAAMPDAGTASVAEVVAALDLLAEALIPHARARFDELADRPSDTSDTPPEED
jgi:DNA-binding MarR family transcriptional regulator